MKLLEMSEINVVSGTAGQFIPTGTPFAVTHTYKVIAGAQGALAGTAIGATLGFLIGQYFYDHGYENLANCALVSGALIGGVVCSYLMYTEYTVGTMLVPGIQF